MTALPALSLFQDKTPLSLVFLEDFHIALGTIPQKKGNVCSLLGEGRAQYIHDDNATTIQE